MQRIALITIGQAPREDVVASMFGGCPPKRLIQHGALDALSDDEIHNLQPREAEHPLVSRLRSGAEVVIAKERLMSHMQEAVDKSVRDGATLIVILCTGEFSELSMPVTAIYPDRVLDHVVEAILPSGTVGVMLPHPGQLETMRRKWTTNTRTFAGTAVSPYSERDELGKHAQELVSLGVDLIVLDCMGFDGRMKRTVAEVSGLPTILANRLVGRVVEELISIGE